MKKNIKKTFLIASATMLSVNSIYATEKNVDEAEYNKNVIQLFPAGSENKIKNVIVLAPSKNERDTKVEIIATKKTKVDCNLTWYVAKFNKKDLKGYGYNYYDLSDVIGPMSTKTMCLDRTLQTKDVPIHLNHNNDAFTLLNYNSRLPIVVYAPKDVEITYRLWTANKDISKADIVK